MAGRHHCIKADCQDMADTKPFKVTHAFQSCVVQAHKFNKFERSLVKAEM